MRSWSSWRGPVSWAYSVPSRTAGAGRRSEVTRVAHIGPADPSTGSAGRPAGRLRWANRWAAMREDGVVESRDDECSKPPEPGPTERHNGRRRWIVGALLAQLFLVSVYVAILTSGRPPIIVATSLAFMLAFSGVYVFVVGRVVQSPISRRSTVVGLLFVLTLPQLVILGPDAAALWIFVAVAGGMLFRDRAAFALALALAGLMLILDAVAGQPLSWELALTLFALTAFMVG